MAKILNLVIEDRGDTHIPEAYVHSFELRDSIREPEKALRAAVDEFVQSGTEDSKQARAFANGYYNWADAMSSVHDALFEKHGLKRIYNDAVDVLVDHDEVLVGRLAADVGGAQ